MYRDVKCAVQPAPIQREAFAAAEGDRACAVAERLTRKGWPLAAKSLEGFAQMQCSRMLVAGSFRRSDVFGLELLSGDREELSEGATNLIGAREDHLDAKAGLFANFIDGIDV